MMRRRLVPIGALALLVGGCVLEPATEQGRDVAELYTWFMIAAAGVFVVIIGLLAWTVLRYRGQPGRDAQLPPQTSARFIFEVVWWTVPTLLVAVLAVLTIGVLNRVDARQDQPDLTVEVVGYQWGWQFTYADSGVVVNGAVADPARVVLPTGRSIAFEIRSRDVVHSFTIPAFLIKRDAIPTRLNRFDVTIVEEGTYSGQCGEFCGLLHARQLFEIDAVSPAAFDAWLAEQESAP